MNNNKNQRCIVSIVEKHPITENLFLFSHICSQVGTVEDNIFYDDQGQMFFRVNNDCALDSSIRRFFASDISVEEALKSSPNHDIQEAMTIFEEEANGLVHLVYINQDQVVISLEINETELINNLIEYAGYSENNNQDNERKNTYWKNLVKNIEENRFSKEQLQDIKNTIKSQRILFNKINKLASKRITDEDYLSLDEINNSIKETVMSKNKNELENTFEKIDIDKVFHEVTKTLIAQDEPAKRLIIELARMIPNKGKNSAVLLTGSSGVGKTLLMSLIAKNINRPFLMIDSTQLTKPGYEGKNIENYLYDLYIQCGSDKEKAERAIIFFDEIDKKGSSIKDDVSGRGVLNVLLKFLDGISYTCKSDYEAVEINTSKMIIIAGGSFQDVYNKEDATKRIIGFNDRKTGLSESKKVLNPKVKDFISYGNMTKEFMGRFPVVIKMNDLSKESMIRILRESDESPITVQKQVFKNYGVDLEFTEDAISEIAEKAIAEDTGARGLNGIVLESTYAGFEHATNKNNQVEKIIITDETISDPLAFKTEKKDNSDKEKVKVLKANKK